MIDRSLAPDLSGAIAQAGVDPTLEGRALQDVLRAWGRDQGRPGSLPSLTAFHRPAPPVGKLGGVLLIQASV